MARGIGPTWLRYALIAPAVVYLFLLLHTPQPYRYVPGDGGTQQREKIGWKAFLAYFATCTGLFPEADWVGSDKEHEVPGSKEFRIEAFSCDRARWEMLDPQPYFPIQSDDKESRLPRIIHFYIEEGDTAQARGAAHAIEGYLLEHHADDGVDDGVPGRIGGIRISRDAHPVGTPGDDVPRYHYDPLSPLPATDHVTVLYNTTHGDHDGHDGVRTRCKAQGADVP